MARLLQRPHCMAANVAGAAGNENCHHPILWIRVPSTAIRIHWRLSSQRRLACTRLRSCCSFGKCCSSCFKRLGGEERGA
jgi:hypothetical protein